MAVVLVIGAAAFVLYAISYCLVHLHRLHVATHRKIWNIVLLLSFLAAAATGPKEYSIPSASLDYYLQPDGSVLVQERITYSLESGDFSELYSQKPLDLQLSDASGSCQGAQCTFILQKNNSWRELVLRGKFTGGQKIDALFSYKVDGAILSQEGAAQFYYKLWGEQWQRPVGLLEAKVHLPGDASEAQYFLHPYYMAYQNSSSGKEITISSQDHPAGTFLEINALMPEGWFSPLPQAKNHMPANEIIRGEQRLAEGERQKAFAGLIYGFALMLFLPVAYAAIYLRFGTEKPAAALGYQMLYEREPPGSLSPAAASLLIDKGSPQDRLTAEILNLVQLKFLSMEAGKAKEGLFGASQEVVLRILKSQPEGIALEAHQRRIFEFLLSISSNSQLTSEDMKRAARQQSRLAAYQAIEEDMQRLFGSKRYLDQKGNMYMAAACLAVLFIGLPAGALLGLFVSNPLFVFALGAESIAFIIACAAKPAVLGRWSDEGRLLCAKWENFYKFLNDMTLMRDKAPSDIVLWEQYLVYATAFGIAGKVRDSMKAKFSPQQAGQSSLYSGQYAASALYGSVGAMHSGFHAMASASGRSSGGFGSGGGGGGGGGGAR